MKRSIIVLAAHDDGSGAHVTIAWLCRALIEEGERRGRRPLLVYLNGSSYGFEWAHKRLFGQDAGQRWLLQAPGDPWPTAGAQAGLDGVWLQTDNILKFLKEPEGTLAVAHTRAMLGQCQAGFANWGAQLRKVPRDQVVLAVEMGVPQLARWAKGDGKTREIPVASLGDMIWSRTMRGSLDGAGEMDDEILSAIEAVAVAERCASEVWTFPLIAPRSYADFFADARIPLLTLPGLFGVRPTPREVETAKDLLRIRSPKTVVAWAGTTGVWCEIYLRLATVVRERSGGAYALVYPASGGRLTVVEHGRRQRSLEQPPNIMGCFACADLGITRGGITMTEFIAGNLPFVVVQEPDHWLSRQQQAQMCGAGLSHSACLSRLLDIDMADELIGKCLEAQENEAMRMRMASFRFGQEKDFARYLLKMSAHG